LFAVLEHALQDVFEVFGAIDLGEQVAELVAGFEELAERLDLLDDLARVKSSSDSNFNWTAISLPSSASVFSTRMFRPGVIRFMMSLKLSRSIWTNLRSFMGFKGWVG